MLKDIADELVRYYKITRNQIKEYYEIPAANDVFLSKINLNFQSMQHLDYRAIPGSPDYYLQTPINYILVTIESNSKILIYLYIYLTVDAARIDRIETNGGILEKKPPFDELMRYMRSCLGLKREDFEELLKKLKILNVSVV